MARVLFHHLVCMFSLLCAKQKFVAVHIILWGVKAAFNGEHAQHSCVLCLWYSLLSQVSGAAFRGTQRLSRFDSQRRGSQREYWLGVSSLQAVYLPSSAACNFEREELTNSPQRPLCQFWPVFLLLFLLSSQPGRKQLLWNTQPASSAHHLSARSEKQRQIWALFCL